MLYYHCPSTVTSTETYVEVHSSAPILLPARSSPKCCAHLASFQAIPIVEEKAWPNLSRAETYLHVKLHFLQLNCWTNCTVLTTALCTGLVPSPNLLQLLISQPFMFVDCGNLIGDIRKLQRAHIMACEKGCMAFDPKFYPFPTETSTHRVLPGNHKAVATITVKTEPQEEQVVVPPTLWVIP